MTVLAEYFVTADRTWLFLVRGDRDRPETIEVPLRRAALRDLVGELFGAEGEGEPLRRADPAAWSEPFDALVAPLAGRVPDGETVWFVPHDVLHYLPLHALKLPTGLVAERHPVCYSPSAGAMRYCRRKRQPAGRAVRILAGAPPDRPLVHAYEQATAVARLFGEHSSLYLGDDATAERLTAGEPARVLHLACHGLFNAAEPMRSGLMLAQDALITSEQVLRLSLPADLVTLSACQSGVNARRPGDELIGLTRSFIYAGAASLLVSLWSVDELSTSLLMRAFYQALLNGAGKADALRTAQLALRATTAADVIAYCTAAIAELEAAPDAGSAQNATARALLAADLAGARLRAGDAAGALAAYTDLLASAGPEAPRYGGLRRAAARARAASRGPATVDHERTMYDHPYYWAPFALVGDWR
ncbi:CHAT domain-containing protein [Dactylosporangium sp. NPDC000521]|uniref:CHAT domain-containing protein n=1 Tax=Dactylosporangium sp. NPDC000521 TaxID=3363975 RepID=UPI0036B10F60